MIPAELLSMAGGFIIPAIFKLIKARQEGQAALFKQALQRQEMATNERTSIREIAGWFGVTRRLIAITIVIMVVVVPILTPLITIGIPVAYCHDTGGTTQLLFGLFSKETTNLSCRAFEGVVIQPFHTHLVAAVAGLYFGSKR